MTEAKLTIGHIARAAGVNVETVRYYQRRGLVNLPAKRARGFRYYTLDTARRVRFIKRGASPWNVAQRGAASFETRRQRDLHRPSGADWDLAIRWDRIVLDDDLENTVVHHPGRDRHCDELERPSDAMTHDVFNNGL